MRALAPISSDLVGCVEGAPLLQTQADGEIGRGCLMIRKYVLAPMVACQGVCEVTLVRGDAVQRKGSSMRGVADVVGWGWTGQEAHR
jgi:hypothetical protein